MIRAGALAVMVALVVPSAASASLASVEDRGAGLRVYVDGTAVKDLIEVTRHSSGSNFFISGYGDEMQPGAGCAPYREGEVSCPAAGVVGVEVLAAEGDDTISVHTTFGIPIHIVGGDGDDSINEIPQQFGLSDARTLEGGPGNDFLRGGIEVDRLDGGPGDDTIIGDAADDTLIGDAGADTIAPDRGKDVVQAGEGDDTLVDALDLERDAIDCGGGADEVDRADRIDAPVGCEKFTRIDFAKLFKGRFDAGRRATEILRLRVPTTLERTYFPRVVRCNGKGCPFKRRELSPDVKLENLFKKPLPVGTQLDFTFLLFADVGPLVRFTIRSAAKPKRERLCGDTRGFPIACP